MRDPMRLAADRLAALTPEMLCAYLEKHGWQEQFHDIGKEICYGHSFDDLIQAIVPLRRDFVDYVHRVADVIIAVATVEQRKAWEVLADLEPPRLVTCPHCGQNFPLPYVT